MVWNRSTALYTLPSQAFARKISDLRCSVTLGDDSQGHLHRSKGDRTRRSWTDRDEEMLVNWLKELFVTWWKSYNGFRAGYLTKLENAMNGFNNNNDYKIDCDDDPCEHIVKYWQVIFGKDRADGPFSEDLTDAANLLSTRNIVRSSPDGEFGHSIGLEDENPFVTPTGIVPLDDTWCVRKEVYDLLGRLPLTRNKFDVGEIILEKVQCLAFFLGMPEEGMFAYATRILAKYG
ncbi:hypothetical protein SASPL_152612 [Salvia splendens]|uniref:Uncharacterized protein n=1 Tax=Salvia splendens TaxID=180675 RepID=A0A8X8W3G4_SALSN|nr:hypothetical protein SASPL_152612 [Salvia splendens]